MSVADKLNILKQQKQNNINAVTIRHTYSGENKVDVSNDILAISSKPYGQCVTFLRRPYLLTLNTEVTGTHWNNLQSNTVLGNGDNPIELINSHYPYEITLKDKNNQELYKLKTHSWQGEQSEYKDSIIRWTGFGNEFNLHFGMQGDDEYTFNLKFSYGDFVPKNNCITEFIMEYSKSAVYTIKIYKILVRYTNP